MTSPLLNEQSKKVSIIIKDMDNKEPIHSSTKSSVEFLNFLFFIRGPPRMYVDIRDMAGQGCQANFEFEKDSVLQY